MNLWPTVAAGIIFIAILFIVGYAFEAFLKMVDGHVNGGSNNTVDTDDEDEVYHRYYSGGY